MAQSTSAPAETIDLTGALRLALERNLNLKQSANDVNLSHATVAQERANFLPNLNLSVGPSLRFGRAFDQSTASLTDQRSEGLSFNASSNITLFNGFTNIASLREAQLNEAATKNNFDRTRQGILYQTTSQYLQVFLNGELIRVEDENMEAQRQQLASIEAQYEAGNRPIADVLQQRAAIAQTEQRLIAAQHNHELAQQQLKQTLHLPSLAAITFAAPDEALLQTEPVDYNAAALIEQALAAREDLSAQRYRIEAAEQGIRVARGGYLPSVSLNASTGTNYTSLNEQFSLTDQLGDVNPNGSIGLSVSIPVFNRLQTKTTVERAQVGAENERLALEIIAQEVAYDVQQALLNYQTAQAQLLAAERQLEAAQEALAAAEARYDVGASTLLEVTEARSLYVEAASGRLEAQYNVLDSELAIAYQTGQLDEALVARLQ